MSGDETSLHEVQTFRCTNDEVSCARLRCQINSWPAGSHNADLSIRMDVNFTTLGKYGSLCEFANVCSCFMINLFSCDYFISQLLNLHNEYTIFFVRLLLRPIIYF